MRAGLITIAITSLLGALTAAQLLAGCACSGADSQGNGITPIPIPGCGAQGASPDAGASDVAAGQDAVESPDGGPALDAAADGGPGDLGFPDGAASDSISVPDGMTADVPGDLPADADGGPDAGDGGPDAGDGAVDAGPDAADGADLPLSPDGPDAL